MFTVIMDQAGKEINWHVRPQTSMAASSCCCRQRVNQRKCQRATLLPECVSASHLHVYLMCVKLTQETGSIALRVLSTGSRIQQPTPTMLQHTQTQCTRVVSSWSLMAAIQ